MVVIALAAALASVLVPRTFLPRYLAAWVILLAARSVQELEVDFGDGVSQSTVDGVLTLVVAVAFFVFAHLVFVGFLQSNWGLFVAAGVGVVVGMYVLTD